MSNQDKFNAVDYAALEKMSTKELKDLLQQTFDQPALSDEDTNQILAITEVLEIRKNEGDYIDVDVDAAWETFQKEYLPLVDEDASSANNETDVLNEHVQDTSTKKKNWRFTKIAGIAAALAIVIFATGSLIPTANGSSIWDAFVEWTQETFGLGSGTVVKHEEYPKELKELNELLGRNGYSVFGLLPKYIPEGFSNVGTDYVDLDDGGFFVCQLKNSSSLIVLNYKINNNNSSSLEYQKNDVDPELVLSNQHSFYVIQNMDLYSAIWIEEGLECSILNVPTHDELLKIINSIYEE
mgnify:CR=1 FL=1